MCRNLRHARYVVSIVHPETPCSWHPATNSCICFPCYDDGCPSDRHSSPDRYPFSVPRTGPCCAQVSNRLFELVSAVPLPVSDGKEDSSVPVRSLLVQHAVTAVAAADGLATLELHIAVTVAAGVGHGT